MAWLIVTTPSNHPSLFSMQVVEAKGEPAMRAASEFASYLFTAEAQREFAKVGFRVNPKVCKTAAEQQVCVCWGGATFDAVFMCGDVTVACVLFESNTGFQALFGDRSRVNEWDILFFIKNVVV